MKQREEEWFKAREGKFTASNISLILTNGRGKPYGISLETLALEKAVEVVFGRDEEEINSFDIERGILLEPLAFNRFKELKSYEFIDVKEATFFPYGKHAGASPDGLVGDDAVLEIKCPRRAKFFKIVANGKDEIDPGYYDQMQMQMLATNSKRAHFFNYFTEMGLEYWHEIVVDRDEERIDLIKERIKIATEIKLEYIEKLKKNKQW